MATFECETSEPFVKVKWYKDGVEIHTGDKYRMHSDRKVHFLSVLTIDTSDAEDYSCVLVEDENVKTTAKLIVEGSKWWFCCLLKFSSYFSYVIKLAMQFSPLKKNYLWIRCKLHTKNHDCIILIKNIDNWDVFKTRLFWYLVFKIFWIIIPCFIKNNLKIKITPFIDNLILSPEVRY